MNKTISGVLLAAALSAGGPISAQDLPQQRRAELIGQIMERFMENYRMQAGLTTEQNEKFRIAVRRSFQGRQELQQRERQTLRALEMQMRPGIAANADSVTKLVDALIDARASLVEHMRTEQKEFATYLNPVQRAQLVLAWARFENQIDEMVRRRMEQGRQGRGAGGGQ